MAKILIFLTTLILLQGCFVDENITKTSAKSESAVSFITDVKDGVLYIEDKNSRYKLADDAIDYRVIPSPNRSRLAVETLLLSNLMIIRFYKKDSDGRYRPVELPAVSNLWENLAAQIGFNPDDIRFPRMKFLRWEGEKRAHINLSAVAGREKIDRNISVTFP